MPACTTRRPAARSTRPSRARLRRPAVASTRSSFVPTRPPTAVPVESPRRGCCSRRRRRRRSVLVGDKRSDLEAARAVGCGAVLVRTGYGRAEEAALRAEPGGAALYDACVDGLAEALPVLARLFAREPPDPAAAV